MRKRVRHTSACGLNLVLVVSAMRTMFSVLVTVAPPLLEMCMASGTKLTK